MTPQDEAIIEAGSSMSTEEMEDMTDAELTECGECYGSGSVNVELNFDNGCYEGDTCDSCNGTGLSAPYNGDLK